MATLTVYPDPHPESTSVDGQVYVYTQATWSGARDASSGTVDDTATGAFLKAELNGGNYDVSRFFYLFDTSALTSGAVISAATLSIYDAGVSSGTDPIGLVQTNPASNTSLTGADFIAMTVNTPTEGATRISSFSSSAYNNFTLNASGISWISKTGISKFGVRFAKDIDNSAPAGRNYRVFSFSETSGTANDPKLVITYTVASGPANLKSYNTNVKANIKSINTNAIANVKSLNTNV